MRAATAAAPSRRWTSAHVLLASVSAARLPRPWRACVWDSRRRASTSSRSKNRPLSGLERGHPGHESSQVHDGIPSRNTGKPGLGVNVQRQQFYAPGRG